MIYKGPSLKIIGLQGASLAVLGSCLIMVEPCAAQSGASGAPPSSSSAAPIAATPSSASTPSGNGGLLGDVVVTARRRAENLQDVPVSVEVVSGDEIKKLSITDAAEISKVAPGLTITDMNAVGGDTVILRGVRWSSGSGQTAIPFYLNEGNFGPQAVLAGLYDVGQIEVLRGPQGTTRGAPSISGAVTLTTHTPDLERYGGYFQALGGEGDHRDVQGAVNIPLIQDKLAVRIAGYYDANDANRVDSLNSSEKPNLETGSLRISVRAKPIESVEINASYQRLDQIGHYFTQVDGPGSPGVPAQNIPANYNGPTISSGQELSVQDIPNAISTHNDLWTLNAGWSFLGQRLSYNYAREIARSNGTLAQDETNTLVGYNHLPLTDGLTDYVMNEVRLSSQRGNHFIDYDVGYFRETTHEPEQYSSPFYLSGAFGAPGASVPLGPANGALPGAVTTPLSRYTLSAQSTFALQTNDESEYANVQFHLPFGFELSGGGRYISIEQPIHLTVNTGNAYDVAVFFPVCTALSPLLVNSPSYPGYCDFNVPASSSTESFPGRYHHTIWNTSLSRKFTPGILAYTTIGTSYRVGLPAIDNTGLAPDQLNPNPEKATSYEVGLKTSWGRRLRINADIYDIEYDGQLTTFQGISYFNSISQGISQTSIAYFRNVNARVRGAEAEIIAQPITNLALEANLSYSDIRSQGGQVPCNNPAVPLTATNPENFCTSAVGQNLNASGPFEANVNGNYNVPLGRYSGYARFNFDFNSKSPNFGISTAQTPSYGLLDLFAGLTGTAVGGAWDFGVYAKNVLDNRVVLTSEPAINAIYAAFGPPGYNGITTQLPREVGVQLRYSWGGS